MRRILVLGFGNPGRLDDGLGPAIAEAVVGLGLPHVTVDTNFQLSVEDAADLAEHDLAIFVDAAMVGPEPFAFSPVEASDDTHFTTHYVEPAMVLGLARRIYRASTEAYLLAIRGYEFEAFGECLSEAAQANLEAALRFLVPLLEQPARLPEAAALAAEGDFDWTRRACGILAFTPEIEMEAGGA